jgi:predicted nucleic-acid-binding protein
MRVTVDTNVLLRAAILDDPLRAKVAADLLNRAAVIAVPLPVLCEFAWVLARGYRRRAAEILAIIGSLLASVTVQVDRPAVEAGLAMLEAGGDFADGVIAFDGCRLGGTVFASFDRRAVELIAATGAETRLLGPPAH